MSACRDLIGANFVGERIDQAPHLYIPALTDIPLIGRILFAEDAFVYLSIVLVIGIWWFLYRTRAGLILRAVGDNPASAHALGYPVLKICAARGAVRRGLRGSRRGLSAARLYAVLRRRHDGGSRLDRARARGVLVVEAGALVIGAYLFGAVTILQLHTQALGWAFRRS